VRFLGTVVDRTAEHALEEERELFLAALGHDLRDPVSAIALGASALLRQPLSESVHRTVSRIASSADRMAALITQLLDFARARAGQPIELKPRPTDLLLLWRQVAEEIELAAPTRRLQIQVSGDAYGRWDPERMLQVFSNLAWNAVHYGAPTRPIEVTIDADEARVAIVTHNEGTPIPAEVLPRIFDPFRRGGRGRGLGLGLYIARRIVEAHDGTISVTSAKQTGTRFVVTLPK
jgi:signal transduction histidine kinase